ncbi:hypothetical protein M3Y97_00942200 [Aphelenchoides bicaudatus]|nr:hypothetical protein M3Y97_00942200 [Aphelenchoides bicaudatus]
MTSRPDPSAKRNGTVQKCRDASANLSQSVMGLVSAVGSRTTNQQGALQAKVNQVRTALESLRASINALPNIDSDMETQSQRISALQEQLRLKNDFIMKIRERDMSDFFSKSGGATEQTKETEDVEMKETTTSKKDTSKN